MKEILDRVIMLTECNIDTAIFCVSGNPESLPASSVSMEGFGGSESLAWDEGERSCSEILLLISSFHIVKHQ